MSTHYQVGPGVAAAMEEMGDHAVAHSRFEHPWPGGTVEQGFGRLFTYFWDNLSGEPRIIVHDPSPGHVGGLVMGIDVSSHQSRDLARYVALAGADHVIVRMYQGLETPPREHSIAQVRSARDLGCSVGAYGWLYTGIDPRRQINDQLLTASEAQLQVPVLWQDIEHYQGSLPTPHEIDAALDEAAKQGVRAGVYSSPSIWAELGNPTFPGTLLWTADWDNIPDLEHSQAYGEMEIVAKQFTAVAPDGSPLDRNVVLAEFTEAA